MACVQKKAKANPKLGSVKHDPPPHTGSKPKIQGKRELDREGDNNAAPPTGFKGDAPRSNATGATHPPSGGDVVPSKDATHPLMPWTASKHKRPRSSSLQNSPIDDENEPPKSKPTEFLHGDGGRIEVHSF
ncbi:hypothetical protein PIB30_044194 [Stylosanthes scabra]|uniref:Uncharacterized protein n=1 Tax=Stylosanthes scabra TaxID=79078 RepID=A0ABU6QF56_9FABA|nr:hypothetical protein [Stylosanthes scabra]